MRYFEQYQLSLFNTYLSSPNSPGINVRDNTGSPPLFACLISTHSFRYHKPAEAHPHIDTFSAFFDHLELDLSAVNKEGETVLHIIARRCLTGHNWTKEQEAYEGTLFNWFVNKGLDSL